MRRVEPPGASSPYLVDGICDALGALADHLGGQVGTYWRGKVERLRLTPMASVELARQIASGLDEYAWYLERDGWPLLAERWRIISRHVQERHRKRQRAAFGLS
jgi:hypothetical protein